MGADSCGSDGWSQIEVRYPKVFQVQDFLIGGTTSFRMLQLLQYGLHPPPMRAGDDVMRYMVVEFVNELRRCFKDGGFATRDKEEERGGFFLVGHAGRLFRVEGNYQVIEPASDYESCGCGEQYARAVMWATKDKAPADRVRLALEAAAEHTSGVRPPFVVKTIGVGEGA